jgi:phosphomevalonate kinase
LKEHNLDYAQLLSDGPYKETYRADMIQWGEDKRNRDPSYFARIVMKEATPPIVIISDARRKTDLDFFRQLAASSSSSSLSSHTSTKCIAVRVEASVDARKSRGFDYTSGVDDVDSECGLDGVRDWDWLIKNNKGDSKVVVGDNDLVDQIDALAREIIKQYKS